MSGPGRPDSGTAADYIAERFCVFSGSALAPSPFISEIFTRNVAAGFTNSLAFARQLDIDAMDGDRYGRQRE